MLYSKPYVDPPNMCVLGERGDGKSLLMTVLAHFYNTVDNLNIFANYHLKHIEYKYILFDDIASFPDYLRNGVILLDEAHVGTDAYDFFKTRVKDITKFVTQLRKRNLTFIWATQRWKTVAKRLRTNTNYIIEVRKTDQEGFIKCRVYDRFKPKGNDFIKEFVIDGTQFYSFFDTKEIIDI